MKNDILFIEEPGSSSAWLWLWIKDPEVLNRFMATNIPREDCAAPTKHRAGLFEKVHIETVANFCAAMGFEVVLMPEQLLAGQLRSVSFKDACLNYLESRSNV